MDAPWVVLLAIAAVLLAAIVVSIVWPMLRRRRSEGALPRSVSPIPDKPPTPDQHSIPTLPPGAASDRNVDAPPMAEPGRTEGTPVHRGPRRMVPKTTAYIRPAAAYPLNQAEVWGHWRSAMELRQAWHRRSIEQVAADLRRIRALLPFDENRSAVHQFANRIAYDQLLIEACTMLELAQGLSEDLTAQDREFERLRTEASLEYAGLVLVRRTEKAG